MKKAKFLIGLLSLVSVLSFSSCEKEADESQGYSSSELRSGSVEPVEYGIEEFDENGQPLMGEHHENCEDRKAKFFAQLTDEEKAQMEVYKSTLDGVKEKKDAHFASLSEEMQEKLKSHQLTKEEHEALKADFDATLSTEELEALAYMKTLKDKYKPEGAPKHRRR